MSRGLFTMKDVAAAGLRRNDPAAHARQVKDGYITGVPAHRPAVISVNMFAASLAVNELLARLHPFREEPNGDYASVTFSLASMEFIAEPEEGICDILGGKRRHGRHGSPARTDGVRGKAAADEVDLRDFTRRARIWLRALSAGFLPPYRHCRRRGVLAEAAEAAHALYRRRRTAIRSRRR